MFIPNNDLHACLYISFYFLESHMAYEAGIGRGCTHSAFDTSLVAVPGSVIWLIATGKLDN